MGILIHETLKTALLAGLLLPFLGSSAFTTLGIVRTSTPAFARRVEPPTSSSNAQLQAWRENQPQPSQRQQQHQQQLQWQRQQRGSGARAWAKGNNDGEERGGLGGLVAGALKGLKKGVDSALEGAIELVSPKEDRSDNSPTNKGRRKAGRIARDRRLDEENSLSSDIDSLFRDAPFPFQLARGIVKGAARGLTSTFSEAQDDIELIMERCQEALEADLRAVDMLGGSIQCGSPSSQSYSSSSINGVTTKAIALQLPVQGTRSSGYVQVQARIDSQGGVDVSEIVLGGVRGTMRIDPDVPLAAAVSQGRSSGGGRGGGGGGGGDVIDAEYRELN